MKAIVAAIALSISAQAAAMEAFEWEVVNGFPLMETDHAKKLAPRAGEGMVAVLQRLAPPEMNTVMKENRANLNGPGYSRAYAQGSPRDIRIRVKNAPASAQCRWSVADTKQRALRMRSALAVKCADSTTLTVPMGGGTVSAASDELGARTETIVIDEKLVLGFGDSYSSGEGNPDNPTGWAFNELDNIFDLDNSDDERLRWAVLLNTTRVKDARWLHAGCHRSLWSFQALAALAYAAADPHRVVTFLFYSCSGATVDELISVAQQPLIDTTSVSLPQIDQAVADLCPVAPVKQKDRRLRCPKQMRKADAVLLTIGGNDAGFARVIADAILPSNGDPMACVIREFLGAMPADEAKKLIEKLPAKWAELQKAFERSLDIAAGRVFVPAYPNLLYDSQGKPCDEGSKAMLDGLKTLLPGSRFVLSRKKAQEAYDGVVEPMRVALKSAPQGWHVATSHLAAVERHGICAVKTTVDKELGYPIPGRVELWDNAPSPEAWSAYDQSRERWFRTPNDSILSLWTSRSLVRAQERLKAFDCGALAPAKNKAQADARIQGLSSLSGLGIDLMVGSFHPTARYHAQAADALVPLLSLP